MLCCDTARDAPIRIYVSASACVLESMQDPTPMRATDTTMRHQTSCRAPIPRTPNHCLCLQFMPAALAEDSAGSAHALTIRRALKYDPFEAAADAFKSLATAGADAAASAAGRAAGKEAKNVMDAFLPPLGTMPFSVTTPAADTPVAAPLQAASEKVRTISDMC